jgi:outer membrane protein TolC
MSGILRTTGKLIALVLAVASGCRPHLPPVDFWGHRDSDRYQQLAAAAQAAPVEIESEESAPACRPVTLQNFHEQQPWDMPLQEALRLALANSRVVRQLPPQQAPLQGGASVPPSNDGVLRSPDGAASVYDPAIQTTSVAGVDAALSAFDANFATSMLWEKNEQPINVSVPAEVIFARDFIQDRATFRGELNKTSVWGTRIFARHNVVYDLNNNPTRAVPSDYNANYEVGITQPIWQGFGRWFNEVVGPDGRPGVYNGVVIARINSDISVLDFEIAVRDMLSQAETAYWELYLAYRAFHADRTGRDGALQNWRNIEAARRVGREDAVREAQARGELFRFTDRMQGALCELLDAENRLRYLLGLPAGDGRVIRPMDEPTTANIVFDWDQIYLEALSRSPELRRQKWRIQQRELELTAARHFLHPRLDGIAQYRWVGAGDDLMGRRAVPPFEGSDAYSTLFGGDYQEWQLGFQMNMPLGFRQGNAAVRNAELQVARERARLAVQEQELSHLLAEAVRRAECSHILAMNRYNTWRAANQEVESALAAYPLGRIPYSDVLNAFARRTDAETDYFRAVVNYQRAIVQVHLRKGSLLEYNQVVLAECPWPGSAVARHGGGLFRRQAERTIDPSLAQPAAQPSIIATPEHAPARPVVAAAAQHPPFSARAQKASLPPLVPPPPPGPTNPKPARR